MDEVVLGDFDVGIEDHCDAAALLFDFFVHLGYLRLGEVLLVEPEVLVAAFRRVLLGPLDVGPDNVEREAILGEVSVSVHENLSGHVGPLAEVEAKGLDHGHWSKP